MSVLGHESYRSYLKEVLAERARANPAYSLRALAKKLDLAPSHLSAILKGKKNLSPDRAVSIGERLNLKEKEKRYFCLLVQMEAAHSLELKELFLQRLQDINPRNEVQDLSVDHFKILSDWHHFAIFEATDLTDFEATPEQFACALGISRFDVDVALDRLVRVGMLEIDTSGRYKKTKCDIRFASTSTNEALRKFNRQTLQKAIESLETQSPKERIMGSETLAIDSTQIEAFEKLAYQFLDNAIALAKKSKNKDCVYHLGVQSFNLTHQRQRGKESCEVR